MYTIRNTRNILDGILTNAWIDASKGEGASASDLSFRPLLCWLPLASTGITGFGDCLWVLRWHELGLLERH